MAHRVKTGVVRSSHAILMPWTGRENGSLIVERIVMDAGGDAS
jgi:hypothetical protein